MYFETAPKTRKADLFDFDYEYRHLTEMLKSGDARCIVIYGLRRTGKTSLMHVVVNENNFKYVWIDGRSFDSRTEFFAELIKELKSRKLLPLESFELKGLKLGLEQSLHEMLKNAKGLIIIVDEAQYLSPLKLDRFFAYVYDNFDIKVVFSGSEIGVLNRFIGKENPKAPLFGRAIAEIKTRRLSKNESMEFLLNGGKQAGLGIDEQEADKVINALDGTIGWLTLYGWYRKNHAWSAALKKSIEKGKAMAKEEFDNFLLTRKARKKYSMIMKILGGRELSWSELKSLLSKELGYLISDKQLSMYLAHLEDYCFIEKVAEKYKIADPLTDALFY